MTLTEIINSPAFLTVLLAVLSYMLSRIFDKRPAWKRHWAQWNPVFIQAVRYAEKIIPDNHPNKAVARADEALKYTIRVLEGHGIAVTDTDKPELELNLIETHHQLDSGGIL